MYLETLQNKFCAHFRSTNKQGCKYQLTLLMDVEELSMWHYGGIRLTLPLRLN
ncbi:unnamed protein product [Moneuplotes crassus]|uniref:Uncharacterized protein n=1 Tax=Euplotes crassus TaxID=5936 RepID=A0AAD1Y0A2_EUPCR|nr:unnamed protein product [Moneuplotes crassus]